MVDGYRLGVDFGTSNTAAVLAGPGGRRSRLVFGRDNLLPSAVCAQEDGSLLVGRDALRAARIRPECFEPHPKKRVDDGRVLLGAHEVRVEDLVGAVLGRVFRAAGELTGGERVRRVTLTHPAGWGRLRQDVLRVAAECAGVAEVDLVAEPVAAGTHLVRHDVGVRPGARVLVYDFGGGTFDASVIRCDEHLTVLASAGLSDAGGLDIDQAIFDHLAEVYGDRPGWAQLRAPGDAASRRASNLFRDDLREAKEALTEAGSTSVHVPILDTDAVLGRETLDRLARPVVERTVRAAFEAVRDAGLRPSELDAVYLVGGASRLPLVSTMLLERFRIPPVRPDQPEFAVAEGSLTVAPRRTTAGGAPAPDEPAVPHEDDGERLHYAEYQYRHGRLVEAERTIAGLVGTAPSDAGRLLWGELLLLRYDQEAAARQFQLVRDAHGAGDRVALQARHHLARCRVEEVGLSRAERVRVLTRVNALHDEQRRAAGPDDPDTLATRALATVVEISLGESRARTEPALRAVLDAQRSRLAADDPATYRTWLALVRALSAWKDWEAARTEAAALNRRLREHGDGHPLRLTAADAYCHLRTRQARAVPAGPARADEVKAIHADAVRIARAALGKHRDLNGDAHPRTVLARFRFGDCLIEAGDRATGMAELRAALRTADEVMGRDRPRTWQLRLELAGRLTDGGDTDEAEQIYRDAAAALPRRLGEDSPLAAKARDRLANVAERNATLSHRIKRRLRGLAE
ncbi:Hsp70 family protein [Dactylosporangium sp. NPDC006015]|uniref:Hsp70 family protein n=1 Tax=Dactylosporangium sp. NPDC006015 TaxID=3154576 RepID=UPI0033A217EB